MNYMFYFRHLLFVLTVAPVASMSHAQDRIELDTTTIKGNSELPKILYVVPWSEKTVKKTQRQRLVLHSLFGNFYDPVLPRQTIKNLPAKKIFP